jgi:hypothetical protein
MMSPLPVEVVRERLDADRIPYLRASFMVSGFGRYHIVGRVGTRLIKLEARRTGIRNSWRPVLRARLEPKGTGSQLVGRIGMDPVVKVFSAFWLGAVSCVFLVGVVNAMVTTWSGDASGAAVLICLLPLGFMLFFVGLTAFATQLGRGQGTYLRLWLAERLQTTELSDRNHP